MTRAQKRAATARDAAPAGLRFMPWPLPPSRPSLRDARGPDTERQGGPGKARRTSGPREPRATAGRVVWLHGASVGESLSLLPLMEAIGLARPDRTLVVTSGTRTAAELLAGRLPAGSIHQYAPLDTPSAAATFVDHWRPHLVVFAESELWPNLFVARQGGRRGARPRLGPDVAGQFRPVAKGATIGARASRRLRSDPGARSGAGRAARRPGGPRRSPGGLQVRRRAFAGRRNRTGSSARADRGSARYRRGEHPCGRGGADLASLARCRS